MKANQSYARVGVTALLILVAASSFVLGRITSHWPGVMRGADSQNTGAARVEALPEYPDLVLQGNYGTQINVRRTDALGKIESVAVFNTQENVTYTSFYPESGVLSAVSYKVDGRYVREWEFREDGSMKSETVFQFEQLLFPQRGRRTYFREDGKVERAEDIVLHSGS